MAPTKEVTKSFRPALRQLSTRAIQKYHIQEIFGGYSDMKGYLLAIMLIITLGDIGQSVAFNLHQNGLLQGYEIWMVNIPMVLGYAFFSALFLPACEKVLAKYKILRFALLTLANAALSLSAAFHIYYYFKALKTSASDFQIIFRGICIFGTGIYTSILVEIMTPIWFLKALVPISYFCGLIYGILKLDIDGFSPAWISGFIGIFNIVLLCFIKAQFRWNSFVKKTMNENWNEIHDLILNRVPNPIAVFNGNGEMDWCNSVYTNLAKPAKSFLTKICDLKRRRRNHTEMEESSFSINKADRSFSMMEDSKTVSNPFVLKRVKTNAFYHSIETAKNLDELLKKVQKLIKEGKMVGDYLIFDGKMVEEGQQEHEGHSFEVTLSFMNEYQKIIIILKDTTEHARIVTLETNNEYKDSLLASVSHEFKTPLNANLTLVEAAIGSTEIPQTLKEQLLQPALLSGKLLLHLINDILDYYQIAAKKLRLNIVPQSIRDTLQSCFQLMEYQIVQKGLEFSCEVDRDIPEIFTTDHDRVRQIILNLLSNAQKFTFQGKVVLKAEMLNSSELKISVEDTGIGISKEDTGKLFHEFTHVRTPGTPNLDSKGVGLGLVISMKIAKRLGPQGKRGGIHVDSLLSIGSIFSFVITNKEREKFISYANVDEGELPRFGDLQYQFVKREAELTEGAGDEAVTVENTSRYSFQLHKTNVTVSDMTSRRPFHVAAESANFDMSIMPKSFTRRKKRVLVVDDDTFNMLAIKSILGKYNLDIEFAYNGKEAVDKVVEGVQNMETTFSLIFMDCQMPIMDGYEATRTLTQMMAKKTIPNIPIVACTAFGGKQRIDLCYEAGMKDVIQKPLSKAKVDEILKNFIDEV